MAGLGRRPFDARNLGRVHANQAIGLPRRLNLRQACVARISPVEEPAAVALHLDAAWPGMPPGVDFDNPLALAARIVDVPLDGNASIERLARFGFLKADWPG